MSTHGRWLLLQFPYYEIKDRFYMYTVGSMCYGIYFIVSFPMYYRYVQANVYAVALYNAHCTVPLSFRGSSVDEYARWSWSRAAIDSLGACMLVTIMLDLWRLTVGGVLPDIPSCVPYM